MGENQLSLLQEKIEILEEVKQEGVKQELKEVKAEYAKLKEMSGCERVHVRIHPMPYFWRYGEFYLDERDEMCLMTTSDLTEGVLKMCITEHLDHSPDEKTPYGLHASDFYFFYTEIYGNINRAECNAVLITESNICLLKHIFSYGNRNRQKFGDDGQG